MKILVAYERVEEAILWLYDHDFYEGAWRNHVASMIQEGTVNQGYREGDNRPFKLDYFVRMSDRDRMLFKLMFAV